MGVRKRWYLKRSQQEGRGNVSKGVGMKIVDDLTPYRFVVKRFLVLICELSLESGSNASKEVVVCMSRFVRHPPDHSLNDEQTQCNDHVNEVTAASAAKANSGCEPCALLLVASRMWLWTSHHAGTSHT